MGNAVHKNWLGSWMTTLMGLGVVLIGSSSMALAKQYEKIAYDEDNYAMFVDIGRKTKGNSVYFGKAIAFNVTRRGQTSKTTTVGPFHTEPGEHRNLTSHVKEIRYADKNHIWIISRLGKNYDGAVLLNVETGQFVRSYRGNFFDISPDGQDVAFTYSTAGGTAVFISETLVYPNQLEGFEQTGLEPQTTSGLVLSKAVKWNQDASNERVIVPPMWSKDGTLEFLKSETPAGEGDAAETNYALLTVMKDDERSTVSIHSKPMHAHDAEAKREELRMRRAQKDRH